MPSNASPNATPDATTDTTTPTTPDAKETPSERFSLNPGTMATSLSHSMESEPAKKPRLQFSFRYKSFVMVLSGSYSDQDRLILKDWWQQYSDRREKKYDSLQILYNKKNGVNHAHASKLANFRNEAHWQKRRPFHKLWMQKWQ